MADFNNLSMFDIYTTCRNGDMEALSQLVAKKEGKLIIKDAVLKKMIKKAYRDYTQPTKYPKGDPNHYPKFSTSVFTETEENMQDIFLHNLHKVFTDNKLYENENQIYGAIKNGVVKEVNKIIKSHDTFKEVGYNDLTYSTYDYEQFISECDVTDEVAFKLWEQNEREKDDIQKHFTGIAAEAYNIISSHLLKDILPANATIAKELIDIFDYWESMKTNSNGYIEPIDDKNMVELIEKVYSSKHHAQQISKGYNKIYDLVLESVLGYVPNTREEFRKSGGMLYYNFKKIVSDDTAQFIDDVITGKLKNFTLKQYYAEYNAMFERLKSFAEKMNSDGYSVNVSDILYFANHDYDYGETRRDEPIYWNLQKTELKFYNKVDGAFKPDRSNKGKIVLNAIPNIWRCGNCTVLTDSVSRKVYYLSSSHRIHFIVRRGNDFCGLVA